MTLVELERNREMLERLEKKLDESENPENEGMICLKVADLREFCKGIHRMIGELEA